ncbi:MAG: METTL5 family protein [Candidatus Bathyarchaeia archaeon]|nr:methyltransferase [Candidatus Bathyarchaeota archaeon]
MVRRRRLEIALEGVDAHPEPNAWLEQYTIPSRTAAEILSIADMNGDIAGKNVVDLGCGTGRLAIGAAILGAAKVIGVDIDLKAVKVAKANSERLNVEDITDWVNADIEAVIGRFDTAIMNPPFGTKIRHSDRRFLLKALSIADSVYSLHKRSTRDYLLRLIRERTRNLTLYEMELHIPRTFDFHERKRYMVEVDLYVMRSSGGEQPKSKSSHSLYE